jgi:peptide/nickel transport system permease protein
MFDRLSPVARRVLLLIPVLLGVTVITFLLVHVSAEDAVDVLYRQSGTVSESVKAATRARLGLDQPLPVQYVRWLVSLGSGTTVSLATGEPVGGMFLSRLPVTAALTAASLALTLVVSVPLGIYCALHKDRPADYVLRVLSFGGNALPGFLTAFLLLYIVAVRWHWLPVLGDGSPSSYILPTCSLALPMSAKYIRYLRGAVLRECERPYVAASLLRGIPYGVIVRRFVLRSSLLSLLPVLALSIGSLLGGTAIIESIFRLDGIGYLAIRALFLKDYPVIQTYVLWTAFLYSVVNLAADWLYHHFDPRVDGTDREGRNFYGKA